MPSQRSAALATIEAVRIEADASVIQDNRDEDEEELEVADTLAGIVHEPSKISPPVVLQGLSNYQSREARAPSQPPPEATVTLFPQTSLSPHVHYDLPPSSYDSISQARSAPLAYGQGQISAAFPANEYTDRIHRMLQPRIEDTASETIHQPPPPVVEIQSHDEHRRRLAAIMETEEEDQFDVDVTIMDFLAYKAIDLIFEWRSSPDPYSSDLPSALATMTAGTVNHSHPVAALLPTTCRDMLPCYVYQHNITTTVMTGIQHVPAVHGVFPAFDVAVADA